ncbi:MAG: hypothetical protein [Bacteriophage sp.]|nr:MAG: hypothetical protein [Bacteriophage sp.]
MKQYKLTGDDVMHYHSHKEFIKGGFKIAFFCALILLFGSLFILFSWMLDVASR